MVDDWLAGQCSDFLGVANSVGALWSKSGGAWLICVAVCCGCFVGGNLFYNKLLYITKLVSKAVFKLSDPSPCIRFPWP